MAAFTFGAVWPIYSATKSDLSTSCTCPEVKSPIALYILPIFLATVVLPVPGFPVNTECNFMLELCLSPLFFRISSNFK